MAWCNVSITADTTPICLSISRSIFPSLVNKTQRYVNSLAQGSNSFLIRREKSTVFHQRATTSDLRVLTLLSAASQWGCKPPQCAPGQLFDPICWGIREHHVLFFYPDAQSFHFSRFHLNSSHLSGATDTQHLILRW